MVNFRELLGLDNIAIKITLDFALVMLAISIVLWLVSSGGNR
jgi:hypothetical protein